MRVQSGQRQKGNDGEEGIGKENHTNSQTSQYFSMCWCKLRSKLGMCCRIRIRTTFLIWLVLALKSPLHWRYLFFLMCRLYIINAEPFSAHTFLYSFVYLILPVRKPNQQTLSVQWWRAWIQSGSNIVSQNEGQLTWSWMLHYSKTQCTTMTTQPLSNKHYL